MPETLRLYRVNTEVRSARLRVPYQQVVEKLKQPKAVLRQMGITPKGVEVDALRNFLSQRTAPLEEFPLRKIPNPLKRINTEDNSQCQKYLDRMLFREETMEAILGRFGQVELIPRYGVNQGLVKKILQTLQAHDLSFLTEKSERHIEFLCRTSGIDFSRMTGDQALRLASVFISFFPDSARGSGINREYRYVTLENISEQESYLFLFYSLANADYRCILDFINKLPPGMGMTLLGAMSGKINQSFHDPNVDRLEIFAKVGNLEGIKRGLINEKPILGIMQPVDLYSTYLFDIQNIYWESLGLRGKPHSKFVATDAPLSLLFKIHDYDAIVAVAKQGLRYTFLAEMAGLKVYVLDAHGHHKGEGRIRWLTKIAPGELKGKRILVVEDDIESGRTMKLVTDKLRKYGPRNIELLLTNPAYASIAAEVEKIETDNVHYLEEFERIVDREKAAEMAIEYMLRQNAYLENGENGVNMQEQAQNVVNKLKKILRAINKQLIIKRIEQVKLRRMFFGNILQYVSSPLQYPQIAALAREKLEELDVMLNVFADRVEYGRGADYIKELMRRLTASKTEMRERLVSEVYYEKLREYIKRYQGKLVVEPGPNIGAPIDLMATLKLFRKVMREGDFEVAVVIGPEGGRYAVPFELAGVPLVNIHVNDSDPSRPFQSLDDLNIIRGKKVLLIEDDVHTGATLRRTLEQLDPYGPSTLDLLLGNPLQFQTLSNIPVAIRKTYVSDPAEIMEMPGIVDWFMRYTVVDQSASLKSR